MQDTCTEPLKIMIVDDHTVVRYGISRLLEREENWTIVAEAWDYETTFSGIEEHMPDVVIMDVTLNQTDGLHLTRKIRLRYPQIQVVIYTMHDEAVFGGKALLLGAHGYVMKDSDPTHLIDAVHDVTKTTHGLNDNMSRLLLEGLASGDDGYSDSPIEKLSDREREVFHQLALGLSTRQIAKKFGRSIKTIETHRERIKGKLDIRSASELLVCASRWLSREGRNN